MPTALGPRRDFLDVVAPTAAEDAGDGYLDLDRWYDTATSTLYVLEDAATGTWTAVTGGGGGGGAPTSAQYLTLAANGTLTAERILTLTAGQLSGVDSGAGAAYTVSIADNPTLPGTGAVLIPIGTTAQRPAHAAGKLRGNTTLGVLEWSDGVAWNQIPTSTGAPVGAQYVTLATDATLTSERVLTAGTLVDLVDGGAGGAVTIDVDLTEAASVTPTLADEAVLIQSAAAGKADLRTVDRVVRRTRPQRAVHWEWDFLTDGATTTAGQGVGIETNDTGASTTATAISEVDHPGQVTSTTGTSATSGATFLAAGSNAIRFGGGTWVYEAEIKIPTLSTSLQRFAALFGFFDVVNVANQVDGAYLLYDEGGVSTGSAASANWQLVTAASSSRTFTTSGTAVGTGWTTLRIEVNAAATSVEFFVDGVSLGTIALTIPTSASQLVGAGWCIKKSIGTTARTVVVDYLVVDCQLTSDRAA